MAIGVAAVGVLLAPLPTETRQLAALVLFVALPGHLFVQAAFGGARPGPLERGLLALGSGYVLAALLTLALYALFRPLHTAHVLAGAGALNCGLLAAALARRSELRPRVAAPWPVLAALALAAAFRLPNLDYSEFQGDEAEVALRALAVLQGVPDALIAHRKPPGEVLLAALFAGGLGTLTELTGRVPFALAGVAAVAALYQLGRALFGERAGVAAALLLAVNGYFVALGRMLQYQGPLLLVDILAVLCLWRFSLGPGVRSGYAVVGALLLAGSALLGFSAVFMVPVAAVALWPRAAGARRVPWTARAIWLWPSMLLVPITAAVYGVLAHGPGGALDLAGGWLYLGPRVGGRPPYFNLDAFLLSANHYTSSLYLLVVLGVGVAAGLAAGLQALRHARSGRRAAAERRMFSARRALAVRLALAWVAVPFLAYLLLVRSPGTHWREAFPGLLLVVGVAAAAWYARLADRRLATTALLAGGVFLAATGHYLYVAWLRPWPEYQAVYPLERHPLDWSTADLRSAGNAGGIYGMARHHGWKLVGSLMARGVLPKGYDTNESLQQAAWYLRQHRSCGEAAPLFIQAPTDLEDYLDIRDDRPRQGYRPGDRVTVGGRTTLALLRRTPTPGGGRVYAADDDGRGLVAEPISPWEPIGRLYWPKERLPRCPGGR